MVKCTVEFDESLAGQILGRDIAEMGWQRAFKTPGQKEDLCRRMPVWEIAFVMCHYW